MAIVQVIKCELRPNTPAPPEYLVVEHWGENYTTSSHLIVDESHQAVFVVNGQTADTFGAGTHALETPNIPLLRKIINIPTGGEDPFTCKVFYVSKVHQMDMLWGTQGPIALNDPVYNIFLHVMLHGSMAFSVVNPAKFLAKLVGFRSFTSKQLMESFRGLVSAHVKDSISQIMIKDQKSYFEVNADLFATSQAVKSRLDTVFDEYGIRIEFFNIETVEVPREDYEAISRAKERDTSRKIEGYTWADEQQMKVAQTFAANEGAMGGMAATMGGIAGGMVMGNMAGNMIGNAFQGQYGMPMQPMMGGNMYAAPGQPMPQASAAQPAASPSGGMCPQCGQAVPVGSKFCGACGTRMPETGGPAFCPQCGQATQPGSRFCNQCGNKLF